MEVQEKINNIIIICGHILLAGNFPVMMMKIKSLASTFEKKGMGPTTNVLGIKVIMNKDAKLLYQDLENYLEKGAQMI